jgi:hypothetical protein
VRCHLLLPTAARPNAAPAGPSAPIASSADPLAASCSSSRTASMGFRVGTCSGDVAVSEAHGNLPFLRHSSPTDGRRRRFAPWPARRIAAWRVTLLPVSRGDLLHGSMPLVTSPPQPH